jgi:WD40 repeat protein
MTQPRSRLASSWRWCLPLLLLSLPFVCCLLPLPFVTTPTTTPDVSRQLASPGGSADGEDDVGAVENQRLHLTRRYGTLSFRLPHRLRDWAIDGKTGCLVIFMEDRIESWHPRTGQVMRSRPIPPLGFRDSAYLASDGSLGAIAPDEKPELHLFPLGPPSAPLRLTRASPRRWGAHVAFTADNALVVAGSYDGPLDVFDVGSGRKLLTLMDEPSDVCSLVTCGSSGWVACGTRKGLIHLHDPLGRRERVTLEGHKDSVYEMAASGCGKYLVSAEYLPPRKRETTVLVWDLTLREPVARHVGEWYHVAMSRCGDRYCFLTSQGVEVWSLTESRRLCVLPCRASRILTDDDLIYTLCGGAVRCWDGLTGKEITIPFGHFNSVVGVAPFGNGALLTWDADGRCCLWDSVTARLVRDLPPREGSVALAADPEGRYVVRGSWQGDVESVDLATGQAREVKRLLGRPDSLFVPGPGRLVAVTDWWDVWTVNTDRQETVGHVYTEPRIRISHLTRSGSRLVTAHESGELRVWAVPSLRLERVLPPECDGSVIASFLDPGEKAVVIDRWAEDGVPRIILVDLERGKVLRSRRVRRLDASAACCSSDGKLLAVGTSAGEVACWSLPNLEFLGSARGHGSDVRAIAFSPDGRQVFTGSADCTAACWTLDPLPDVRP